MDLKLKQAKEWAGIIRGEFNAGWPTEDHVNAAAEVIEALPDQWVDAEKVRELIGDMKNFIEGDAPGNPWGEGFDSATWRWVKKLEALTPAPPLQTLADMTPEEREACQWMQAISDPDSGYTSGTVVIAQVKDDRAVIMWDDGSFDTRYHQHITPLPDLPRMVWPDEHHPATDAEEAPEPETPRPEDVPAGEAWLILRNGHEWVGTRESSEKATWPWSLARLDGVDYGMARDSAVTLASRLVPERKENA